MLGKLKEVNGNVRMTIDKLKGIRSYLVRTDDDWQTWDFRKLVDALRKWTERNPLPVKVIDKNQEPPSYPIYQTHQGDMPLRSCVYCDSTDHRSHERSNVTQPSQRKRILQLKSLFQLHRIRSQGQQTQEQKMFRVEAKTSHIDLWQNGNGRKFNDSCPSR